MAVAVDAEIRCLWAGCRAPGPFPDHSVLFEHLCAEHNPTSKRTLDCKWRGCSFRACNNQHYADHLIRHTSYRPHCCTYPGCTKTFNYRPILLQHSAQHDWSSVAAYPCDWSDCAAAPFASPAELRAHLQETHAPAAVHGARCGWAGCLKTLDRRHITAHLATHLPPGYKPFRCTICNKAFRTAGVLKAHAFRTHGNAETPRDQKGAVAPRLSVRPSKAKALYSEFRSQSADVKTNMAAALQSGTKIWKESDSESELDIVITVKLEEPDTQAESLWAL